MTRANYYVYPTTGQTRLREQDYTTDLNGQLFLNGQFVLDRPWTKTYSFKT